MIELINFLQSIGDQALEFALFPLLIWTAIALPIAFWLHYSDSIPAIYQYHGRVALLLTLPLGIVGTYLFDIVSSSASSTGTTALFVIQNPISVSASDSGVSIVSSMSNSVFWIGILSLLLVAGIMLMLSKIISNYFQLKKLQHQLNFAPLVQNRDLISSLPRIPKDAGKTFIAFSKEANIPFTFGWRKTKIVIPADLKKDSGALAMAVQHELIHIRHRDFLLNSLLILIKAFFWFHPLIHYLYTSGREYREITCDGEVLSDNQFSKKRYASLLFELAKREHHKNIAISMAVNPSSLKKRIQIMSSQNNLPTKFRSSLFLTMMSAALIVAAISCTDIEDNGITNTEFEEAQTQLKLQKGDNNPLYVVNGERWDNSSESNQKKLAQLKPKYIKSVNVLKGNKATEKYGESAKYGAIELTINNPEKALIDLKENDKKTSASGEEFYVAVEKMPELVGGLASIQKNINYPEEAREARIEGRVIVQFIVNKQGEVINPQIIKGIGKGCDEEALRVVQEAKFKPGMQQGEPVRVQYALPISYKLSSGEKG